MSNDKPKFVAIDNDRHGNERIYFRKQAAAKVRLRGPYKSAEFWDDYLAAVSGELKAMAPKFKPASPESFRWLCIQFYTSAPFLALSDRTRYVLRLRLDNICARMAASGAGTFGDAPYRHIEARHLRKLLDAKAAIPNGANNDLKALKALFKFAAVRDFIRTSPAVDVAPLSVPDIGFHAWTAEEREVYRKHHPVGSKARLAFELILLTGVRRSDAVKIGRPHVRVDEDGENITFTVTKNARKKRTVLTLPVLPALRAILDASKDILGDLTFLTTEFGRPYSVNGFGAWFKRQCVAAGLHHCSAHGLRKLAASTMADNGATAHQLMAVFGWSKISQAEVYTRGADQKRMARDAMARLGEQPGHKTVPLSKAVAESGMNSTPNPLKVKEA